MTSPRPGLLPIALAMILAGCAASTGTQAPASATPDASPSPSAAASGSPRASGGPSSPGPTSPGPADEPWSQVAVALPSEVTSAPSLQPGYQCHPCHYLAENDFIGVASTPIGAVAVGVQEPPSEAIAYLTTDGTSWVPVAGFAGGAGSAANAVAANGRRIVVVGLEHSGATAWASADGSTWRQAPEQASLEVPYAAGGMTAVTAFGAGFVAGGYRDDPLHVRASAAVWRSDDGLTWRLDEAPGVFDAGRIWGMAATSDTIVAVGTSGDPNYGPAGAWRWTRSTGWQRARIAPDGTGAMKAVVATTSGFVAVGLDGRDRGARSWTSKDGLTWTAAPDQPAFHYAANPVRMQSVAVGPGGLVAGGWRSDPGKGSAVTWTSTDGLTWRGPVWEPSFSGGQITGVVALATGMVAVGRLGYPDWDQASAWLATSP